MLPELSDEDIKHAERLLFGREDVFDGRQDGERVN